MIGRVVLILIAVALLMAMIGKLRLPKRPERPAVQSARKCPDCSAYVVGSHPEPCGRADCRYRTA